MPPIPFRPSLTYVVTWIVTLLPGHLVTLSSATAAQRPEYNRDVRPILAENCFACHGPDSAARKAKLRLDQREAAIEARAIVPGKPDDSGLVQRIFTGRSSKLMPPAQTHRKLTAAQKDLLRRWIAGGAEYQPHWSFIPPKRPARPAVKNPAWVRNPIDRFILAELEKQGLQPAPEADRRTLARRLSLDLTGLPPSAEDVDTFANDKAPDAYERLVDRLLMSPHWGEHRARYWLDAARYADTHGIHFDNYREMWSYRDWVINAFNRNLTFDRFTVEQLGGDLLPNRALDQAIASGFNRCNITTNEGGAIAEEYLVLYTRDRVETTSQVWLGLTAGCAVCHDHKFDPLTQREFYQMAAFFNNTTQAGMDGNIKDTPPVMLVPRPEDQPRWQVISSQLEQTRGLAEARKKAARPEFQQWLAEANPEPIAGSIPSDALQLHIPLNEGKGSAIAMTVHDEPRSVTLPAGSAWDPGHIAARAFKRGAGEPVEVADVGDFDRNQAFSYGAWVRLPTARGRGAILARMDDRNAYRGWDLWVEDGRFGVHIVHKWPGNAIKVSCQNRAKAGEWNHVFVTYDGSGKAAGVRLYLNGVPQDFRPGPVSGLTNTVRARVPLTVGQRHRSSALPNLTVQDVRVYARALPMVEVERLVRGSRAAYLVSKPADKRSPAEINELFDWWLPVMDKAYQVLHARLSALKAEEVSFRSRGTIAHVMQERAAEPMAYLLFRGEYDRRRDPVHPGTPHSLPPWPADLPKNRLGFARWLLRPEQPLTARVTVNRFWQELFGTGIVRTSGDFGLAGELPSHPELLDWLAVEFRESGWDVKQFFKLLVTSATYRQAATTTPQKREKDPHNRLLSRGPRFRMDAEMIRDYALASSGLLVGKVGGPSVKPYQPDGVWEAVAMIGSNTRDYKRDSGENLYRRSMYTFWKRSAPPASMDIFNAPSRETCAVRRERTNTPLQALVTLNDPQFVEAARHLAQRALKQGGDRTESRIDFIARRLLARSFRPEEMRVVQASLDDLVAYYQSKPDDARKLLAVGESKADAALSAALLAAWTMLVNELMNLDEALNK